MLAQLPASLLRPAGGPERLEPFERGLDCLAGRALLTRSTPDDPECEEGTRPAERVADAFVLPNRLLEQRDGVLNVARCRGGEPTASAHVGERPAATESRRFRRPFVQQLACLPNLTEREQRLDMVRAPRPHHRFEKPDPGRNLVGLRERACCLGRVSTPERGEPSDRLDRGETQTHLGGQSGSVLGEPASALELAAMKSDECDGKQRLRHVGCVLAENEVGLIGVLGRERPPAGLELDQRQIPARVGAGPLVAVAPRSIFGFEQGARPLELGRPDQHVSQ